MNLSDFTADTNGLIVFSVFAAVLLVQLFYYLFFYSRLAFYKPKEIIKSTEPVSVIICARNEEDNLRENLPLILAQDFPDFEVIVVNDRSYDGSYDLLKDMAEVNPKLKFINIDEEIIVSGSKKFALTLGIKKAANDILLLTDADCKPASQQWISQMQGRFTEKTDIVLGVGVYRKKDFSLLNMLIRYDTFLTALQYLSYSLAGQTYMGVGRNLAYRKHLFFDNKGFGSHNHIRSGDDDLFINEVAHKAKVNVSVSADSQTLSGPKTTWSEWFHQKRRHLTTGPLYKTRHQFLLGTFMFSQLAFYPLLVLLIVLQYNLPVIISLFALRFIIQFIVFAKVMKSLNQRDLLLISPIIDLVLPFITLSLSVSNMLVKPQTWK
jgi:cellulose synthase/poly-beta-1,6-N-acetylglucosamine synthase-like glycosyltransferase